MNGTRLAAAQGRSGDGTMNGTRLTAAKGAAETER